LRTRPEIIALAKHKIKPLPHQRYEIEAGNPCDCKRRDATIRVTGANGVRDFKSGGKRRLHQIDILAAEVGARQHGYQQQLCAGALRPLREPCAPRGHRSHIGNPQRVSRSDNDALLAAGKCDDGRVIKTVSLRNNIGVGALVIAFQAMHVNSGRHHFTAD